LQAQWQLRDSSVVLKRYCLDVLPSGRIFVGGNDSSSLSTNFGQTWVHYPTPISGAVAPFFIKSMNDVFFKDDLNGFAAVGDLINRETIVKTTDGGLNWTAVKDTLIAATDVYELKAIHFPTADVGYCAGWPSRIFKTTNGGANWGMIYNNASAFYFNDIFFANRDTGFAIARNRYQYTKNGGSSWTSGTLGGSDMKAVHMPVDTVCYVVTAAASIIRINLLGSLRSYNYGTFLLPGVSFYDVYFTSLDTGYIAATGRILRTTDGGKSLEEYILSPRPGAPSRIKFSGAQNGVMCAEDKYVFTTGNAGGFYKPVTYIEWTGTGCPNMPTTFTASGNDSWSYQTYINNTLVSTSRSFTYSFPAGGNYTVSTIASNGTASDTSTRNITISTNDLINPFTASLSIDSLCGGIKPTISTSTAVYAGYQQVTVSISAIQPGVNYKVYNNGTLIGNGLPCTFTAGQIFADRTLMVTADNGNSTCGYHYDTAYATLHIISYPPFLLYRDLKVVEDTICVGDSATIQFNHSAPGYQHRFAVNNLSGYSDFTLPAVAGGDTLWVKVPTNHVFFPGQSLYGSPGKEVEVFVTSPEGCDFHFTSRDSLWADRVTADFNTPFIHYLNTDTIVPRDTSDGDFWKWSGTSALHVLDSIAQEPNITTAAVIGKQTITLTASTVFGCSDTATQDIYLHNEAPDLNLSKCYRSTLHIQGADSNSRHILDQHVDRFGSLYVCGYYYFAYYGSYNSSRCHLFITKFDSLGNLLWDRKCAPYGYDTLGYAIQNMWKYAFSAGTGITTDQNGNVYVSGNYYSDYLTIDSVVVQSSVIGVAHRQGFILKLDNSGKCKWIVATRYSGYSNNDMHKIGHFSDIEYWDNGKLLVGGKNIGNAVFNNDTFSFSGPIMIDTNGNYIQQYTLTDPNLNSPFINSAQGSEDAFYTTESYCTYPKLQRRNGTMYIHGLFRTLATPSLTQHFNSASNVGIFAGRLSQSGWQSMQELGSTNSPAWGYAARSLSQGLTTDDTGNYYVLQDFADNRAGYSYDDTLAYFNNNVLETVTGPCRYISKYSPSGNLIWKKKVPPLSVGEAPLMRLKYIGHHLYVLANFHDNFPGIESNGTDLSFHCLDYPVGFSSIAYAAILKLDPSGNVTGTINAGRNHPWLMGMISTDPCEKNLYVSGSLMDDLSNLLYRSGSTKCHAAKYAIDLSCAVTVCNSPPVANTITVSSCSNPVLISPGQLIYDAEGDAAFFHSAAASSGNAQVDSQQITYSPGNANVANDTLVYVVCDYYGACDTGRFFINRYAITAQISAQACQGTAVNFNGIDFYAPGIFYDTLVSSSGCDSIVALRLTIHHQTDSTIAQTACESYILNGQTYDSSGVYLQTLVNGNGCDSVITLNLVVGAADSSVLDHSICQGESFLFNGLNISASGIYQVALLNASGCDSIVTLSLSIDSLPLVTLSGNADTVCSNAGVIALTGGNPTGGTYLGDGVSGIQFDPALAGPGSHIITYTAADGHGCISSSSETIEVSICSGIVALSDDTGVSIYPNPATDELFVMTWGTYDAHIKIYSSDGKLIDSITTSTGSIDISNLSSGVYVAQVESENAVRRLRWVKL
jgi:photosystem II stability/assembly factor-like uncharacterized protein